MSDSTVAGAAAAVAELLASGPTSGEQHTVSTVGLAELNLPDHTRGERGGVAEARDRHYAECVAAMTRDERAQRQGELDQARDEGYRAGLLDGRVAAEAEGLELLRALPQQIDSAIALVDAHVNEVLGRVSADLLAAALEIAQWIVAREVVVNEDALLEIAGQALRDAGGIGGANVVVPPTMGRVAARWASRFGVDRPVIVEDPAVPDGTVFVKSLSGGEATVSLPMLLARARESLGLPEESSASA